MAGAALARPHPAHHVRPVLDGLLGVKSSLLAGEALADDFGFLVQQQVGSRLGVTCSHCPESARSLTSGGCTYITTLANLEFVRTVFLQHNSGRGL